MIIATGGRKRPRGHHGLPWGFSDSPKRPSLSKIKKKKLLKLGNIRQTDLSNRIAVRFGNSAVLHLGRLTKISCLCDSKLLDERNMDSTRDTWAISEGGPQ